MGASEIKYVYSEWESKGQAVLLPYALQYNYEERDWLSEPGKRHYQACGVGRISECIHKQRNPGASGEPG